MPENECLDDVLAGLGDVTTAIVEFSNSPEFRELDRFYRRKSTFEILGIERLEAPHSRFLAWLLDPSESHGLGTFGLTKFLEVCVLCRLGSEQKRKPLPWISPDLLDKLIVGQAVFSDARVQTELSLGKNGRIDIHIDCTLSLPCDEQEKTLGILIENKVNSAEHDSQTVKYGEWRSQNADKYNYWLLVYLTPTPTLKLAQYEEPDCECKDFLQINYQYLVDYLIEPALSLAPSEESRDLICDYLRALSRPAVNDTVENISGDFIMALSEQERKLLTAFWKRHKPLFQAAFYAISTDPDQDPDDRNLAENWLQSATRPKPVSMAWDSEPQNLLDAKSWRAVLTHVVGKALDGAMDPDKLPMRHTLDQAEAEGYAGRAYFKGARLWVDVNASADKARDWISTILQRHTVLGQLTVTTGDGNKLMLPPS